MTWPKRYGGHEIRPGALRRYGGASGSGGPGGFALDRGPSERPEHPAPRHGGAEEAISPATARGELLLDRYERTRERLGSRLRADGRRTGRRRVARQRHEDLDRGAHRSHHAIVLCRPPARRARSTRRPQPADTGLLDPRHDGHPDPAAHRRARLQRGHYGGCGGAGWDGPRQHRRRLETGHLRARLRAERTGAILSTFPLFVELVRALGRDPGERAKVEVGVLGGAAVDAAPDVPLGGRRAGGGGRPEVEAALVKDLGTGFEREVAEAARLLVPSGSALPEGFNARLAEAISHAPAFTQGRDERDPSQHRRARVGRTVSGVREGLVASAARLFRRLGKDGRTGWLGRGSWGELEKAGLTLMSVPEGSGGPGAHSPKPWPFCASSDDTPPPFHSPRRTSWRMGAPPPACPCREVRSRRRPCGPMRASCSVAWAPAGPSPVARGAFRRPATPPASWSWGAEKVVVR